MTQQKIIKQIAIDWVCPLNHNPTTPYEINEVKRLVRFAQDIILALGDEIGDPIEIKRLEV